MYSDFQKSLVAKKAKAPAQQVQYYAIVVLFVGCIFGFGALRFAELASLCTTNPLLQGLMSLIVVISLCSFFVKPSNTVLGMVRKMALLGLVVHQMKKGMDSDMKKDIPRHNLQGSVAVVTGANSGIGFAVVEKLLSLNSTVVMTCRSEIKCRIAASKLKKLADQNITVVYGDRESTNTAPGDLVPQLHLMNLDLEDLMSVRNFVDIFSSKFRNLDILVNNAGSFVQAGSRSKDGIESSIAGMHIGHFALTKWLTKLMIRPAFPSANDNTYHPARVINIADDAFFLGSFHSSMFGSDTEGDWKGEITDNCCSNCCPYWSYPYSNGYARAKLANVLHIQELQRRIDEQAAGNPQTPSSNSDSISMTSTASSRRIVAASLHPGTVRSSHYSSKMLNVFFAKYLLRSPQDAASLVMHTLFNDDFIPGSYIDGVRRAHDLTDYRDSQHIANHFKAFPLARSLPFAERVFSAELQIEEDAKFSLHKYLWARKSFITPAQAGGGAAGTGWFGFFYEGRSKEAVLKASADSDFITLKVSKEPNANQRQRGGECAETNSNKPLLDSSSDAEEVGKRLWEESEAIVAKWEAAVGPSTFKRTSPPPTAGSTRAPVTSSYTNISPGTVTSQGNDTSQETLSASKLPQRLHTLHHVSSRLADNMDEGNGPIGKFKRWFKRMLQ